MKAHSIEWSQPEPYENSIDLESIWRINDALSWAARVFVALVPAMALVVAAVWVVSLPQWILYFQVSVWAMGFVFLGLALDSRRFSISGLHILSGLALFLLAWLSRNLGGEFLIVAAVLVAAWVAAALFRLQQN